MYSSTKCADSRDVPVRNIQSVGGIFQYKICGQQGYCSTKHSVSRDIPVQNADSRDKPATKYSISGDIPLGNRQ
jgi:hypothetical protein